MRDNGEELSVEREMDKPPSLMGDLVDRLMRRNEELAVQIAKLKAERDDLEKQIMDRDMASGGW